MNKELSMSMYVRTKRGSIHKITQITPFYENEQLKYEESYLYLDNKNSGYRIWQYEEFIARASFDKIDLVEENDLVNGYLVIKVSGDYVFTGVDGVDFKENNIKTIITHEQLKANEYVFEE